MNRLVLIGNGFDLAAGLKSSYEHFLVDYFKKSMIECLESSNNNYSDNIMSIKLSNLNKPVYVQDKLINIPINKESVRKTVDKIATIDQILKEERKFYFKRDSIISSSDTLFEIEIHSKLFKDLLGDYNWKDIESYYFTCIESIYEMEVAEKNRQYYKGNKLGDRIKEIRNDYLRPLNYQFEQLKLKIIDYLCCIECEGTKPFKFIKKLRDPLDNETFKRFFNNSKRIGETENRISSAKFINFNYTFSLECSFNYIGLKDIFSQNDVLYIHGFTHHKEDIIFGYGDDTHSIYKDLELTGDDEYLKHLKSFHYPLNQEYIQLMDYIEHDQFEVIIAGHSLGISDRVLLKSIFEHDNCKCIRFLHRGRDDEKQHMKSRYMALSRHFDNKMIMRNKIVPFDFADELH